MDFYFNNCKDREKFKWKPVQSKLKALKFCQLRAQVTGRVEAGCFMGSGMSQLGIVISTGDSLQDKWAPISKGT